jgi:hypothetical protein
MGLMEIVSFPDAFNQLSGFYTIVIPFPDIEDKPLIPVQ